ncbi:MULTISPECIES: TraR/DksA C4-type zinc finger protein [Aeromonas]|uniref:Zinc finger DksA/TraR C4-type domain-containing protein n=1 Tax=Aeromonas veronii TaxID=654 RepID=A0A4S5CJV2_AERVE|nr:MULTISPECIES: TraR/DksA C4-type zinc finger protein [Aeromonas]THJ43638.1 hypothetical protein E8Q35_15135 [Aeromonas veronii]
MNLGRVLTEEQRVGVIAKIHDELSGIKLKLPELRATIRGGEIYSDESMVASKHEENANAMMEINRLVHRQSLLVHALKMSDDIGFCEDCGNDVPYQRYVSNPAATCCMSCQEIREFKAKHVRQAA